MTNHNNNMDSSSEMNLSSLTDSSSHMNLSSLTDSSSHMDSTSPQGIDELRDEDCLFDGSRKKAKLDDDDDDDDDRDDDNNSIHILTFCPNHARQVKIELLSSHTIYDLISTLCDHVAIGQHDNENADSHMWFIKYNGKKYESGDFECTSPHRANDTQLKDLGLNLALPIIRFDYDYGAGLRYVINFTGKEKLVVTDDGQTIEDVMTLYPRRKPFTLPSGYTKYDPTDNSINLDETYTTLYNWIFKSYYSSCTLHFFQPGKKRNWGFFDTGNAMIYLPVKPNNLSCYLSYFDQGAKCPRRGMEENGDGYPHYSWHSVVVIPKSSKSFQSLRSKYSKQEAGFCDFVSANDDTSNTNLNSVFPKLSALAGFKKDTRVPKGWMTFHKKGKKCSISVYKGKSHNHKSNAPKFTAYDGDKQHDPVDNPFLHIDGVEIKGLQDLFCVAEGLLRSY